MLRAENNSYSPTLIFSAVGFGIFGAGRSAFTLGVTYDTPSEKLERIPSLIRAIIESHENTRFDRSFFMVFGDSALNFETVD